MFVIPVLDLLKGVVVRAVGGRRAQYGPIQSVLTRSIHAVDVATAFREQLGLHTLYVADLDAILHGRGKMNTLSELHAAGHEIWIDAGVRSIADAARLFQAGASQVVVALETLPGPRLMTELVNEFGASRLTFSLDLRAGRPMTVAASWPDGTPLGITQTVFESGCRQMIVLDLASVGEQSGLSTLALCGHIRQACPGCRLITGGGVRNADDLRLLDTHGLDGVLVSTALHNGTIDRAILRSML